MPVTSPAGEKDLGAMLAALERDADAYFEGAQTELEGLSRGPVSRLQNRDSYWDALPLAARNEADQLVRRLLEVGGQTAEGVRSASLASEADQRDVMTAVKAMRAAIRLRKFRSWDAEVLHDEGTVLGVQPARQSDDHPLPPDEARKSFASCAEKLRSIIDLVATSRGLGPTGGESSLPTSTRYRPNTAFIMMPMARSRPELVDVADAIKNVFKEFGIEAVRADDIEHEGLITDRILDEIRTAEFLFADLTDERPSVYYEVGYAHALKRRVILCRKAGTGLHFDLAGYNCPEYNNLRDLRDMLSRRLEHLTNRRARSPRP